MQLRIKTNLFLYNKNIKFHRAVYIKKPDIKISGLMYLLFLNYLFRRAITASDN